MSGTPYVLFGVHGLFGDYAEAVHALGGRLARVVMNMDEPPRPPGRRFIDRLDRHHAWRRREGDTREVEVLRMEDYGPEDGEVPLLGFRGLKVYPLVEELRRRFGTRFPPIVHPAAHVAASAELGEGVFVGAGVVVASHARVGDFSLLNRGALIGHDDELGACTVVSPGAQLGSAVVTGPGAVVGIGATVLEERHLGEGCYVAGGAVVLKDVPEHTLVAGVPAEVKKQLRSG